MSGMLNHGHVTLCTFHKQTCLLAEFECVLYTKCLFLFSLKRGNFPFWLKVRYRRCCQKNVVFLQLKVGQSYAFHWLYRSNLIQLLYTQKSWFYHFQTYDGQWNGSEKDHMWKTPATYFSHTWAWDSSDAVWNQTFGTFKEWSFQVPP